MKHFQEVYKSDLQAVKIRLVHFLEIFHVDFIYNGSQWVYLIFPLSEIGGSFFFFFGINTDLQTDLNWIPYTVKQCVIWFMAYFIYHWVCWGKGLFRE